MVKALRYKAAEGTDRPMVALKQILCLGGDKSYRDVFYALADLITRPECHNDGREDGTNSEYYDFACSYCGHCCDLVDVRFCPHCGALVVSGATGSPQ